jgi:hypothetical protein
MGEMRRYLSSSKMHDALRDNWFITRGKW